MIPSYAGLFVESSSNPSTRNAGKLKLVRPLFLVFFLLLAIASIGQTYFSMSSGNYTQNFANIANTTAWPSSFNGTESGMWRGLAAGGTGTIPTPLNITTSSASFQTSANAGGVHRGTGNIQLLSTGGTDNSSSTAIELYLNFTGRVAGTLSFNAAMVANATGNRAGTLRVYASVNGTDYVELSGTGTGLPYTATNNVASSSSVSVALPTSFNGASQARLRFYYHNGSGGSTGSRPKISIDDISVTSTAAPVVTPPTVTTIGASNISTNSAQSGGSGLAENGAPITGKGVVWSTAGLPVIGTANQTNDGTGTGDFTSNITGLAIDQSYFFRAYATNSAGTTYGETSSFRTLAAVPAAPTVSAPTVSSLTVAVNGNGNPFGVQYAIRVNGTQFVQANGTLGGSESWQNSNTFGTIVVTGLAAGTLYNFEVKARNGQSVETAYGPSASGTTTSAGTPTISVVGIGSGSLVTNYGTASSEKELTISGSNLSGNITVTAPVGFELSTAPTSGYSTNAITLTQTGGTVTATPIYVRLAATTNVGIYSGNVTATSGATTGQFSMAGSEVFPTALTITGIAAISKTYDGTDAVTMIGTPNYVGLVNGESFSVVGSVTYAFPSAAVGSNLTLVATGSYAAPTANYTVTQPVITATIEAKELTVSGAAAQNKTYDGTTAATITGTLNGVVTPDVVSLNGTGFFASPDASATPIAVTSSATLSGADAGNYTLAPITGLSALINQASQTINFPAIPNQVVGAANFNLTATATSGLPVTYMSSNGSVATVTEAGNVTIVGVGTTTITASQSGDGNYAAATDATQTLSVTAAPSILAGWNFNGLSSPATATATTFSASLSTASNGNVITRGPGATASTASNSFRTTGFQNNGISTSNTDYFQIRLTPTTGNVVSLSGINARFNGTAGFFASPGVTSQYAYSLDGTNFTLIGSPVQTTSLNPPTVDLSGVTALQNVPAGTTITIRYYASGQTSTGGWGFTSTATGDANNGLSILGFVSAAPTVANPTVTDITTNSATLGAEVTNDGGQTLSARGTVWATTANPTTNALAEGATTIGSFTQSRTGFNPNTTYFFRGYATNATGTGYSADGSFTTLPEAPQVGAGSNAAFTSIDINWQEAANPGTATYTFEVQVDNNSDFSSPEFTQAGIASTINTLTAGGLTSGTEYFFRVRSTNATGSSAWSATSAGYSTLVPQNPVVSISGTPAALTTTYGTASVNTTVSVGGFALTGNVTVTAPAGFEVSTSATTGFANSIELTQTGGEVATTTVFVRLAATTTAGSYSGNISVSSNGATTKTLATTSSTVNPATLTIVGLSAANKIYDRTTDVTVTGTPQYDGLVNGESFAVTGSVTWAFPAVTVGANIALTRTGDYNAPSANYTVTQPTLTASIDAKELTVDGAQAQNKPFDGTTAATITGTLNGVISPDVVTLVGTGTFAVATQGTAIPVSSTSTLGGADAGNYTLIQPTGLQADITAAACVSNSGAITWNFGTATGVATPSANALTGSVLSALTQGNNNGTTTLLTSSSTSTGYTGASGSFNAGAAARTGALNTGTNGSAFFQFTLTPAVGKALRLNSLSAGFRSTSTGPTTISVRTSLDNYATTVATASYSANSNWALRTATASGIVEGNIDEAVTIRIYGHGGTGSASANTANWRMDDLTVNATQVCAYVWSGALNSDWNNTGNWNFGSIPGASDRVTIPATGNQPVIFQTAGEPYAEVGDLTLEAGAELTIDGNNNGQGLTINGLLSGEGEIKASSNNTAATSPKANLAIEGAGTHTLRFVNGFATLDNFAAWVPAGSTVELQSGMTLYGDLTWLSGTGGTVDFNDNAVTLRSTASRTASVGRITGALNGATNVTVERYIPANASRAWRLLSVPTYGAGKTFRSEWQEGATSISQNPAPGYGTILTSASNTAVANGFDAKTNSGSIYFFDDVQATPGWAEPATTTSSIDTRSGYFVFIRGDRTQTPTTPFTSVTPTTLRTTGTLYTGTQPAVSINADQFKLVGNVYASAIDFTALDKTGIDNTFWVWDPKLLLGGSLGAYQTFTATPPFNFAPLVPGGSYSGPNSVIESGQAFFVKAGNSGGSVTLTEAAKTNSANNVFRPLNNPIPTISTKLYSATTNAYFADINYATFDPSFSIDVDGDDVVKFSNTGENAAIKRDGNMLMVESRPMVSATGDSIHFQMWNLKQQAYRFEFVASNMQYMPSSAVLIDKFLNTATPLSLMGGAPVSHNFTVTSAAGSGAGDRFVLVLNSLGGGPLPVTFTQFSARKQQASVQLNWTVTNELNIERYEVERSADGRRFTSVLQQIATTGNAVQKTYQALDVQPLSGTGYYRIKSVGTAGDVSYTNVVRVQFGQAVPAISLLSNPVRGGLVRFQMSELPEGRYQVVVRDMSGKQLVAKSIQHVGSASIQEIGLPATSAGNYILELTGEGYRFTEPFLQNQ